MRVLVDRCAGRRLGEWLREHGYDVLDASEMTPDPGDRALLERAVAEGRVLITLDKDFGDLIFLHGAPRTGVLRLPHCPAADRLRLADHILDHHGPDLEAGAIVTVRGDRVRVSRPPGRQSV